MVFIICCSVLSCLSTEEENSKTIDHVIMNTMSNNKFVSSKTSYVLRDIVYYKDTRTNLCFVGSAVGHSSGLLTNVPCTPEVEKNSISF